MNIFEKKSKSNLSFTSTSSFFLDAMRVLASQMVVFGHGISFFGIFTYIQPPRGIALQNLAVVVFFILSGVLITKNLMKAYQTNNFTEYFSDRFVRIYITLIPCLIFIFIVDYIHRHIWGSYYSYDEAFNLKTFFGNLLMLQDYPINLSITSFGSGRSLWTLAIEWWIYLSFGFFLYLLKNYGKLGKSKKIIFCSLFLLSSIVPIYNLCSGRGGCLTIFWLLGSAIYFFLLLEKFVLSFFTTSHNSRSEIFIISSILLFSIFTYNVRKEYDLRIGLSIAILFLSILLYTQARIAHVINRLRNTVAFMASYSFSLYLIHYTILDIIYVHQKDNNKYILLISSILISNFLSILISNFTERYYKSAQTKFKQTSTYEILNIMFSSKVESKNF